jgi:hypothetical protein
MARVSIDAPNTRGFPRSWQSRGSAWHIASFLCALHAAPVAAQEQDEPDASVSWSELTGQPPALASELDEPTTVVREIGMRPTAPPPPVTRPRGWRMPRELVRRPLTLPQGVLRFDSTIALSEGPRSFSSLVTLSGFFGASAGILDDLEVGATPLGLTIWPIFSFDMADPSVYVRGRALSGEVQLAFRAGTTIPIAGQLPAALMELGAELAWLASPMFRLDVGLDYGLLFSDPLHQRIGIPVTASFQINIHTLRLTAGCYVFNDFDDVDVPLLLAWVISFRGYRGPGGEWMLEGGVTDAENASRAWTLRMRITFFAYL